MDEETEIALSSPTSETGLLSPGEKSSSTPKATFCEPLSIRQEWRQLSIPARKSYLEAVKCLTTKPSRLNLTTSLYDDFTVVHKKRVYSVHHVSASLPWHRYFIFIFEQALKEKCGYEGSLPYWDWTLDSKDPLASPIWDPEIGFGGSKDPATGCVEGGPLKGFLLSNTKNIPSRHCLVREFSNDSEFGELHSKQWSPEIVSDILTSSKTFEELRERIERGPHKHLHDGIGGEMMSFTSSNDPLFYLHHAQVDRLWSMWQQQDPDVRMREYSGKDVFGGVSTVGHILDMGGLGEEGHSILHTLSSTNGPFCYHTIN
ncbi:hypothetical protein HYFRA_00004701 [Hymenoscyphus fraxineus]|uniref:Tyrosinase copper-binding domain-containing protein n=1 Tax=Hymenoscyphus fraxineus TaxID=746836 RepID=A0A9N9KVW9_9HELO|nr:hypothetical protein HYFRA_00004701 [Hymenoscyphus fraxineus]